MRVLVIEDDEELAETVATGLRQSQMAVDVALDGASGLVRAQVHDYDVIVLDRDLPVVHGDKVCAQLVAAGGRSRVLMLTAAAETADLIDGLGLGADDYLTKPFDFPVLVARITALARRAHPSVPPVLEHGDIVRRHRQADRVPRGAGSWRFGPRSSERWSCCSPPKVGSSPPRSCSRACGTRPPTRSRERSRSRSAACERSSVSRP